ncbi:translation initiation factor IF-3 [Roseibium alexandrii]|uniref:translation initiation factor IF-3 n=1 Tax=Roseibium alexandrii TaxID=388408 RepID=UPI00374FEAF3
MNGTLFIWQLIKIIVGFVVAVTASGLFLSWGLFQPGSPEADPAAFAAMIGAAFVTASVLGAVAFVPAVCVILVSEIARLSGIVFHVASAGAIAFLLWTLDGTADAGLRPGSPVVLAAGFVSGAVYWIIAGRTAGNWLLRTKTAPHEEKATDEDL